jgi:Arginine dihydrolase ArgZ-like, C-terminal, Rossmann fold
MVCDAKTRKSRKMFGLAFGCANKPCSSRSKTTLSIYGDDLRPLDLGEVRTYPLASRPSVVSVDDFARSVEETASLRDFLASLPSILAVKSLRAVASQMRRARELRKPIIWGIGGHVIKTGLAPLIIDLMNRGFVTAIAGNGSVLVHDAEIAMVGSTSEDVDLALGSGAYGAAEETGNLLNQAATNGAQTGIGLGEAMGQALLALSPKHREHSLLCASYQARVPFTAHLTIGGDTVHFHPQANGAALGEVSHTDFRLLSEIVRRMNGGGVYLNVGSAVVLPEVFLKCVSLVRNLGHELTDITTANFDFIQSYRPLTNVVRRPTAEGAGHGYSIIGHHELTIPFLAAELICSNPSNHPSR